MNTPRSSAAIPAADEPASARPRLAPAPHRAIDERGKWMAWLLCGYAVLALLSLYLSRQPGSIATIWYANAWAAGLLLHARQPWSAPAWVGLAAAIVGSNVMWGAAMGQALLFVPANLAEMALAVALMRRAGLQACEWRSPVDVLRLLAWGGVLPQAWGASLACVSFAAVGEVDLLALWLTWFEGSVIGTLSVLWLVCLSCRQGRIAWRHLGSDWRFFALLPATTAVTLWALSSVPFPFIYIALPLLTAAMVVSPLGTALLGALASLGAALCIAWGVFVPPPFITPWQQASTYLALAAALLPAPLLSASMAAMAHGRLQLQQRSHELEAANRRLEHFVHMAAHDLREPLVTVAQFTSLLRTDLSPHLTPRTGEYLRLMERATTRMRGQLDDVLRYARVQGEAAGAEQTVDLDALMQTVAEGLAAQIAQRRAVLQISPLATVQGHPALLAMLFQNLVSNALKFVPASRVPHVTIRGETREGHYWVGVSDNGIGIAEDDRARLFKPFARLHTQSAYQGSGLGLALCDHVARLHGGAIVLESRLAQGSTFWVPLTPDPAPLA